MRVIRTFNLTFAALFLGLLGAAMFAPKRVPLEKTVENLMQQVRGEAIHWDRDGKIPGWNWEDMFLNPHGEQTAKTIAIRDLARMGPRAQGAVAELQCLLQAHGDFTPGKGVISYRSDIARALGMIGDPSSIDVLIDLLVLKAQTPDDPKTLNPSTWHGMEGLAWHSKSMMRQYRIKHHLGYGRGPEGIIDGLVLFGKEHHEGIRARLLELKDELDSIDLNNRWVERAIDGGLEFFDSSVHQRELFRKAIVSSYRYR